ncbi:hypothetical protein [Allorhizobium undicola]|uniref:hypothetical protein n=1 Tax=Allorhizobium undicola TaxID=78527 RepID=UPI000481C449|nr:hypothetical protein [Allorhizobium undicola]
MFTRQARQVFAGYAVNGDPRKVVPLDAQLWGAEMEEAIKTLTNVSGTTFSVDTKAEIDADLAHAAGTVAIVWSDSSPENNGYWKKIGASGTGGWSWKAPLPVGINWGVDTGAGTANAIQVTTRVGVSSYQLIGWQLFEATSEEPVTVIFNGGSAAYSIKTNQGTNASALSAGMWVFGIIDSSDSSFRLLIDEDISDLVAQAEAARDEAVAAADEAASLLLHVPRCFLTRAAAVSALSSISSLNDGAVIFAGGLEYQRSSAATAISDMPGWLPYGKVNMRHFTSAWAVDCGPALRAARDYVVSLGGGTIYVTGRDNVATSTETITCCEVQSSAFVASSTLTTIIALPAGVSLVGDEATTRRKAKIAVTTAGIGAIITLYDYKNGRVSDLEIQGYGSANNTAQGVWFAVTSMDNINQDIELSRLYIHDVGSYGIGHNYGLPVRVTVRDIVLHDLGSDGIDWKVRSSSVAATYSESVYFENIEIRRFGLRITGSSSTGLGLRGPAQINGIRVYEIADGKTGIQLVPGIANSTNQDYRISANRVSMVDWYCEAANRYSTGTLPIGLEVFATEACDIGPGVARWCKIMTTPESSTPYAPLNGSRIRAVVIPRCNAIGVHLTAPTSSVDVDVQSDYDLYSTKKGNATSGQKTFSCVSGAGSYIKVVKGTTELTLNTDYTVSSDTVTLTTGIATDENLFIVYAAATAVRVEADYCHIMGRGDRWCKAGVVYSAQTNFDTGSHLAFLWLGRTANMSLINSTSVLGLCATGSNQALRVQGSGTGRAEINRPSMLNLSTYADNAAATAAGLTAGMNYRTSTGAIMVVY